MPISKNVISAGEQPLHPERTLAGIQVERPALWGWTQAVCAGSIAKDDNSDPGKRKFMPRLEAVTPG